MEALGLSLKPGKTGVTHIDVGFVFLGQRIIRKPKGSKRYVYTFVCDEALASIKPRCTSFQPAKVDHFSTGLDTPARRRVREEAGLSHDELAPVLLARSASDAWSARGEVALPSYPRREAAAARGRSGSLLSR